MADLAENIESIPLDPDQFSATLPWQDSQCMPEQTWDSTMAWVDESFQWICRYVRKLRPVPYVVELEDLRQMSYLHAYQTLASLQRRGEIHLFVPFFFRGLSWKITAEYPVIHRADLDVEELAAPDAIDTFPGHVWPHRLPEALWEPVLGIMSEAQAAAWREYLTAGRPRNRPKATFHRHLAQGIKAVLDRFGGSR